MNKPKSDFKAVSLVYGIIQEANALGMKAYAYEKEGNSKLFRRRLEEAYVKTITCMPYMGECSKEIKMNILMMAAWYARDLNMIKECKDYCSRGLVLSDGDIKFSERFRKTMESCGSANKI